MEPLRILLVDDSSLFRKGLVGLFASVPDMVIVGEARDGMEAVEQARELMPDVILMDILMPRQNGVEATRYIKEEMPSIRVVMLTVSESDEHLFESIKAGAHGYLLKNLEPEQLFHMLRVVAQGEAPMSPTIATKILREFAQRYQPSPPPPALGKLSDREKEILQLVVAAKTNREISQELNIAESTVKNHMRNIMDKLHVRNRVQLAIEALSRQGVFPNIP